MNLLTELLIHDGERPIVSSIKPANKVGAMYLLARCYLLRKVAVTRLELITIMIGMIVGFKVTVTPDLVIVRGPNSIRVHIPREVLARYGLYHSLVIGITNQGMPYRSVKCLCLLEIIDAHR